MRVARALLLVALLPACSETIELFPSRGGALGTDASATDGGTSDGCQPIRLGGTTSDSCAASLAASLFRYALCTCESLQPHGALGTQAFDSTGALAPSRQAASVGSNGAVAVEGHLYVGGALVSAGSLAITDASTISQTLRVAQSVQTSQPLTVLGDAHVGGTLSGPISVAGTLYVPEGVDAGAVDAGAVVRQSVTVPPPCPCSGGPDIPALVAAHAADNDNPGIGLDPLALTSVDSARTLDLPCGKYYVSSIATSAPLTLAVHGHTALFVGGTVTIGAVGADLSVALDAGAELDLVVAGGITIRYGGRLGNLQHPSRVRIWVASGYVLGENRPTIAGTLYAPNSALEIHLGLDLRGAAVVRGADLESGQLDVTYDRAVLSGGARTCGTEAVSPVE